MSYLADLARSIKRYEPGDRAALREFQRTYFGAASRHIDDGFFEWLFERNPHRDADGPALWLCKRDGVVVGQQASIPVALKVRDAEQRAAWLIDWMIHPEWRLKGVALALLAANADNNELMLGLGLEDVAYKTVSRAGWKDVGRMSLFVRPLDPQACAQVLNLPALVSKLAPRAVVGGSARVARRIAGAVTGMSMEPIPAFDERVESVWKAASRDYPILVKRDLASLRWRYDEGPFRPQYERYYFKRREQIIGYAVLRLGNWRGQTVGRVVDYLAERRWAAAILALIIDELHAKGAIAVLFEQWHPGSEAILRSLGCLRTRASHRFMFKLRDGASPLAAPLSRAESWYITPGDSDFDHVLIGTHSAADSALA